MPQDASCITRVSSRVGPAPFRCTVEGTGACAARLYVASKLDPLSAGRAGACCGAPSLHCIGVRARSISEARGEGGS